MMPAVNPDTISGYGAVPDGTAMDGGTPAARLQAFPRALDIIGSAIGIVLLTPLLCIIVLLITCSSAGPALYVSERAGKGGHLFRLYKFRTMRRNAASIGSGITRADDSRITSVGRFLRAFKLDELPQLFNVLKGDMSLVGPRPEDPRFIRYYPEDLRGILDMKPGITSAASLYFRDESALLTDADHERTYIESVLPKKLRIDLEYHARATVVSHLGTICKTVLSIFRPADGGPDRFSSAPSAHDRP